MKKNIKTHVVYATTNKKKIKEVGKHFDPHGISLSLLQDFVPVELEIEESGESLGENAIFTSFAYARELCECAKPGIQFLVVSEDTAVAISKTVLAIIHVAPDRTISEPHVFEGWVESKKSSLQDHREKAIQKAIPFIKSYF